MSDLKSMFYYLSASRHQMLDKTLVLANAVAKTTFRQDIGEATRIVLTVLQAQLSGIDPAAA